MMPVTITTLIGDCREMLKTLESESVHTVVTSPPYWGMRNYGGGVGEIGQELTLTEYVANLVEVFNLVKTVLRSDGTLWLNMGDKSSTDGKWGGNKKHAGKNYTSNAGGYRTLKLNSGLPQKNLLGLPWRVAFALQDAGWILRQDIIWHKPNPMPESVTDRPGKCHEYIFLFSKSPRYYYDADAIREPQQLTSGTGQHFRNSRRYISQPTGVSNHSHSGDLGDAKGYNPLGRNKRSVWTVATQSYAGAHFATFPEKLIEPCILAGCPAGGVVLDPFAGSGTTGRVAVKHSRNAVLIELNPAYLQQIDKRTDGVQTTLAL
jgi:DNA modification methylase